MVAADNRWGESGSAEVAPRAAARSVENSQASRYAAPDRSTRRRTSWMVVFGLGIGLLVAAFGDRVLTRIAYAMEQGKIQANADELSAGTAALQEVSNAFRMVAKVVRPGVVQIQVQGGDVDTEALARIREQLESQFGQEFSDEAWERYMRERRDRPLATGSGILFDTDGHILTNNHVVAGRTSFRVRLHDDREYSARLMGADDKTDLAVLKIDAADLHPLRFGDSDRMEVGDWVLAVGAPFGLAQTVTHGIISAKGRNDVADVPILYQDFLQTDAAINPGNSGGPLVNLRGEVIGVNTAIATHGDNQNAGIAFTIPSNMARRIAEQIKSGGRVTRGWLGVQLADLTAGDIALLGMKNSRGVMVDGVYENSPAAAAGLQVEDVIVGVNGRDVTGRRGLQAAIAEAGPGQSTKLRVIRDGGETDLFIAVGEQPADIEAFSRQSTVIAARRARGLDLNVRSMRTDLAPALRSLRIDPAVVRQAAQYGEQSGVLVVDFADAGAANGYGVEPGELVTAVNGNAVATVQQMNAALAGTAEKSVRLQVLNADGRQRTVYIERR